MESNSEYFSEIVYLRAIAILAVISIHVASFSTNGINFLTYMYMSINTFSQFAIPLFVCISGFVLYNKYKWPYSLKVFYKKRFLSVIPQYTIFTISGILLIYVGRIYLGRDLNFNAIDIIYQYLTGSAFYHLWFFILIIELYILYPLIEKIFTKSLEKNKILSLLIFLLVVQILYYIFSDPTRLFIGNPTTFLGYIFYFVLGMYVRFHYLNYKNMAMNFKYSFIFFLSLLFATVLGIGSWIMGIWRIENFRNDLDLSPQLIQIYTWISSIIAPFYFILIFVLCLYLSVKISEMIPNKTTRCLQFIGVYSFGIYLIHAFILLGLRLVIFPIIAFNLNNWLFYPIVFTLVLILSMVFVYIINKVPYHEYIIGSSR
jgi:probable poly-beta-1,6-N-acetyl-D-glucosamine export protein